MSISIPTANQTLTGPYAPVPAKLAQKFGNIPTSPFFKDDAVVPILRI